MRAVPTLDIHVDVIDDVEEFLHNSDSLIHLLQRGFLEENNQKFVNG